MNKLVRVLLLSRLLYVAGAMAHVEAEGLENGDFSHGKSKWLGEGQVVYLKPDGSISPIDDSKSTSSLAPVAPQSTDAKSKNIPIIEMKLHSMQFAELSQKFRTGKDAGALNVELVYKASPDFKLNDKAPSFTKEITWTAGGVWYWSAVVFPKVDLFLRLDKRDGHCYKLQAIKPGEDWQTLNFRWDNVGENQDVTLLVFAPPGHGTLWIKSVAASGVAAPKSR